MGDYAYGLNSNTRSLSPVDFHQLGRNQSLFLPEPVQTMQDETLLEKSAAKPQQLSPNGEHSGDPNLDDPLLRKVSPEVQNGTHEEKKNNNNVDTTVNSVANSLNQLGLSEPNSSAVISSAPSFWSTATADDTFVQGFQTLNGAVTFQNFPPAPNPMFNTNLAPQLGLNVPQQQPPQRRAITGQHSGFPQQRQTSNLFLNNTKSYPTWSSAPQQSSWSQQQNQNPAMNPWANVQQQRRSVPSMQPMQAPTKKLPQPPVNASMLISPSKFRRSTSFPGQMQQSAIGTKPSLDFPGLEDLRDGGNVMVGLTQVSPFRLWIQHGFLKSVWNRVVIFIWNSV